jgi:hypothetical protein
MTRIGTWNLKNLARPGGAAGAPADQGADKAKLGTFAATIAYLDPDV